MALAYQLAVLPTRAFDIADGFAIALIAILFAILGGIAWVARRFRERERLLQQQEHQDFQDLLGIAPPKPPERPKKPARDLPNASQEGWERDPNWWRKDV